MKTSASACSISAASSRRRHDRTPAALAALVKSEIAKWTPVVKPAAN